AFNEGCEAYLVKPFNKESLSKALSELGFVESGEVFEGG
ncbi:unnamed protein product, partial [marine sediment metagenome]